MSCSENDEESCRFIKDMDQKIFTQYKKALKNRTIDIICRGILIKDVSILNKYYEKESIKRACEEGCPNYEKKWSCPPFSKPYYELMDGYNEAALISFSVNMNSYVEIKNKYTAMKAANVTLKNLIEKVARKVEMETKGYALLSGSCRYCRPCACKTNQKCKHPDKMRYSIEATFLNVQALCEELLGFELLWYEKKILPKYTSTVSLIFFNENFVKEAMMEIIKDVIENY